MSKILKSNCIRIFLKLFIREMLKYKLLFCLVSVLSGWTFSVHCQTECLSKTLFQAPPEDNHVYTWWHWMNKGITKEGITKDLEAMKQQGIRGATILNVNLFQGKDFGIADVKFNSPEWYDAFKHALKEANRLGLEIGVQNCDGWSTSGGPWITPEQSMKQYTWSKSFVEGGKPVQLKLKTPAGRMDFYRDVYVIAYPSTRQSLFYRQLPKMTTSDNREAGDVADGNPISTLQLKIKDAIRFEFTGTYSANILLVHLNKPFAWRGTDQKVFFEIATSDDGINFTTLSEVADTLMNQTVLLPFPERSAHIFRVTMKDMLKKEVMDWSNTMDISEMALLKEGECGLFQPRIAYQQAKTISTIADNVRNFSIVTILPDDSSTIKTKDEVLDVSCYMSPDGSFNWTPPAGNWTILRFGYTTTGIKNQPATTEGLGLECDKMDTTALDIHFKNFPQKLIDAAGFYKGNTFKYLFIDSWECRYQNWTVGFEKEFENARGYKMLPYLPVLCGEVLENSERSEAFLHDFRKTIAELIELRYFKHFSDLCHKQGIDLHAEAIYGGKHAPPLDILKTNSYFDVPMTEFWARLNPSDSLLRYNPNNQITATFPTHAATMYDKSILAAEAYTGYMHFSESPGDLKLWGDKAFTDGVNRMVLHSYVHQPSGKKPGMTLGSFGSFFNRYNTWWQYAGAWLDFQARVQYVLQQGKIVSDVLVYLGDKVPNSEVANISSGIRADYCNADILLNQAEIVDGKLTLKNGLTYQLLMFQDSIMELSTLRKIEKLVNAGAIVVCPKPVRTLSLKNYEADNKILKIISDSVWGNVNGKTVFENCYGKGKVVFGKTLQTVWSENELDYDVDFKGIVPGELMSIHKKIQHHDVYYLVNKNESQKLHFEGLFRITGKLPEFWNPVNGNIENFALYLDENGITRIPLELNPKQSVFIVFSNPSIEHFINLRETSGKVVFPSNAPSALPGFRLMEDGSVIVQSDMAGEYIITSSSQKTAKITVQKPKELEINHFKGSLTLIDEPGLQPFSITSFMSLTEYPNPVIKYYSGTAKYEIEFNIPKSYIGPNSAVYLKIANFGSTAEININSKPLANIWEKNSEIEVTSFLKSGENKLVILTTNPWRNRIVGSLINPTTEKNIWTSANLKDNTGSVLIDKASNLLPSGLSSGITIVSRERIHIQ